MLPAENNGNNNNDNKANDYSYDDNKISLPAHEELGMCGTSLASPKRPA